MELLEKIINEILLNESVEVNDVEDALDKHERVIISYHSKGENEHTGPRVIEVYAYGLSKSGNPVIRAFEPYGDTTTYTPEWKFFRLDRISSWKNTHQIFTEPANLRYKNLGPFNKDFDKTMSVVYKIAKFGDDEEQQSNEVPSSQPKTKQDVYKTDTERNMQRLKQQVDNPITLDDIKTNDAFSQMKDAPTTTDKTTTGPKTKQDVQQTKPELYKTDTERGMENLRKQLENPKKLDLSKVQNKPDRSKDLEKLRNTLKDNPMSLADLRKKMNEPQKKEDEIYKTDTERGMENLRKQLENPKKLDLNKIPKR